MRAARSFHSLLFGVMFQLVNIVLSFFMRTALVHTLGITAVSLNGLFTEVIAVLSIAELGVGTAIVYSLYKPLAQGDRKKLAQLMNFFKVAYIVIGIVILAVGLALLPCIHLLIEKVEIDVSYLRWVYILFLIRTVSSYFFAYKSALLGADQRAYVVSINSMLVRIVAVACNIALLYMTQNFILYLILEIFCTLGTNLVISYKANQLYPFLKDKDTLPPSERKHIITNVKHLFIGNLSGKITNSTDNILISVLVGTLQVGSFTSYTMLSGAIKRLLEQLQYATSGSVGNLMAEGDTVQCDLVLKRLTLLTFLLASVAASMLYVGSSPFVKLLFGQEYMLNNKIIFLNTYVFFFYILRNPLWQYMQVSGLFASDKYISIIGSVINLLVSFILGKMLGIIGILLGTICTLTIQMILKTRLLYKYSLQQNRAGYYGKLLLFSALCAAEMLFTSLVCAQFEFGQVYVDLLVKTMMAGVLSMLLNVGIFFRTADFRYLWHMGLTMYQKFRNGGGLHHENRHDWS